MQTKTSVSYKNPKSDIWAAYQELLAEMQPGLPTPTQVKKLETANNNLKQQLSASLTELTQTVQAKLNEFSSQFDQATEMVKELHQLHTNQTNIVKREEEEARYEFEKRRKRESEELAELRQKAETEISAKKAELKEQEDELKELRQKVATFETELTKAVKEAVTKTTQDLTREFTHQKALSDQEANATSQLLQQKISGLDAAIKNYQAEITHLQASLKEANQQLTRIAERAVEKGTSTHILPTSSTKE